MLDILAIGPVTEPTVVSRNVDGSPALTVYPLSMCKPIPPSRAPAPVEDIEPDDLDGFDDPRADFAYDPPSLNRG